MEPGNEDLHVGVASKARKYFDILLRRYGPRGWWPAESPFEVVVGAVLTQNTAWINVEKAIANLKREKLLDPARIRDVDIHRLAEVIRPSGYYNLKAKRLKAVVEWWLRHDPEAPLDVLRAQLLDVNGVGPETADSILLYALNRPSFVVDAYTKRLLTRHGLAAEEVGYDDMKRLFVAALPGDVGLYNEYHALIVEVGKRHCGPVPRCEGCPLEKEKPPGPFGPGGLKLKGLRPAQARARRRRASR